MNDLQSTLIAALKEAGVDEEWNKERVMEVARPLLTPTKSRDFSVWLDRHLDHLIAVCGG